MDNLEVICNFDIRVLVDPVEVGRHAGEDSGSATIATQDRVEREHTNLGGDSVGVSDGQWGSAVSLAWRSGIGSKIHSCRADVFVQDGVGRQTQTASQIGDDLGTAETQHIGVASSVSEASPSNEGTLLSVESGIHLATVWQAHWTDVVAEGHWRWQNGQGHIEVLHTLLIAGVDNEFVDSHAHLAWLGGIVDSETSHNGNGTLDSTKEFMFMDEVRFQEALR